MMEGSESGSGFVPPTNESGSGSGFGTLLFSKLEARRRVSRWVPGRELNPVLCTVPQPGLKTNSAMPNVARAKIYSLKLEICSESEHMQRVAVTLKSAIQSGTGEKNISWLETQKCANTFRE